MRKLAVCVLGTRNAGKTETWKTLFRQNDIRTGSQLRKLQLTRGSCVDVFLISGSPQERPKTIETMLGTQLPDIILCSVQYHSNAPNTFRFLLDHDYHLIVHRLNPGYQDT